MLTDADVVIVGAGLSGVLAARTLTQAGRRVIVLDKSRSAGGRLATRRIGSGKADHGAQFFTVRHPQFRQLVDGWLADGIAFEWSRGWSDGSLATTRDGHPRYACTHGMNDLVVRLADGLDLRTNVQVACVRHMPHGWQVEDEGGGIVRARALLLTPPVPQSLTLLDKGDVRLPADVRTQLERIDYAKCVTLMLHVTGDISLPPPGAIQRPHAPVTWIADNQEKGISASRIITMQAGADYSAALWDEPDERIIREFHVHLMPFMGTNTKIDESQVKRWRYSYPLHTYPERSLLLDLDGSTLAFAGDAFGEPRVEGASLSGLGAGAALAALPVTEG